MALSNFMLIPTTRDRPYTALWLAIIVCAAALGPSTVVTGLAGDGDAKFTGTPTLAVRTSAVVMPAMAPPAGPPTAADALAGSIQAAAAAAGATTTTASVTTLDDSGSRHTTRLLAAAAPPAAALAASTSEVGDASDTPAPVEPSAADEGADSRAASRAGDHVPAADTTPAGLLDGLTDFAADPGAPGGGGGLSGIPGANMYTCNAQDVSQLLCSNASSLAPSWCSYQNPMIIPRPPLGLANASASANAEPAADYVPRYLCADENDPFSDCSFIRRFVPIEVTANNVSTKLIVVASRNNQSSHTTSVVSTLDESFVPLTTMPFPGVTSVLQVGTNRHDASQKYMVFGGNVDNLAPTDSLRESAYAADRDYYDRHGTRPGAPGSGGGTDPPSTARQRRLGTVNADPTCDTQPSPAAVQCTAPGGCAAYVFMVFQAQAHGPPIQTSLGTSASSCHQVVEAAFFHDGDTPVFAALQYNPATGGWVIQFFAHTPGVAPGDAGSFALNSTWTLLANGAPPQPPTDDPVTFEAVYHYTDCRPAKRDKMYAIGGFYDRSICQERALIVVAAASRVSVFEYRPGDMVIDLKNDRFSRFYETGPDTRVLDVSSFGQQIPPVDYSDTNLTSVLSVTAQPMWLTVTTSSLDKAAPLSQLVVISLPEFGQTQVNASLTSTVNPAGLPSAAGQCSVSEYFDKSTYKCLPRHTVVAFSSATTLLHKIETRWRDIPQAVKDQFARVDCPPTDMQCLEAYVERIQHSATGLPFGSLASPSQPEDPREVVQSYFRKMYGLRHAIFVSTNQQSLVVFHALHVPEPCQVATGGKTLMVSKVNELSMMGDINFFSVTPNGQFVFAAVSRPQYFLAAMERLVDVCARLAVEPGNLFLQPYRDACHADTPPRNPSVEDFLQIASSCITGTYCGSFMHEQVERLPDGEYSQYYFDRHQCDPGHFCMQGVRQSCPTGFVCPGDGTVTPVLCNNDRSNSYTCYAGQLPEPQLCGNGTMCGVPYLPPIPSPPGFSMEIDESKVIETTLHSGGLPQKLPLRTLRACVPGEYCNLGRSASEGSGLLCPADTYCEAPEVMEPTICNMGGEWTREHHVQGNAPYCPAGTVEEKKCDAGHYCEAPDEISSCTASLYCPAGSGIWEICPAGFYCPNDGAHKIPCPDGFFCNQGSHEPTKCSILSDCHCTGEDGQGCSEPKDFVSIPVLILVPIALYLAFLGFQYYNKRQAKQREAMFAQNRLVARGLSRSPTSVVSKEYTSLEMSAMGDPAPLEAKLVEGDDDEEGMLQVDMDGHSPLRLGPVPMLDFPGGYQEQALGLTKKEFTITIEAQNLGLKLRTNGKCVLQGVNGVLRPFRNCAVMGPSGAGKSTFISTVSNKAPYGRQIGKLFINGVERSLSDFSNRGMVGFVPQEDVMLRTLTVEEALAFSAATRLPSSWSSEKKHSFVDSTLSLLGLSDVRHVVIGDESERGISGGQRKRVNIGMELVADPTVLFLDEPTSGLDSTSAMEVCAALKRIAALGITIITVVHQPRYEIFTSFHDVLLLGKGGRTVFFGPSEDALPYFESLGLKCPPQTNPADFMLDTIVAKSKLLFKKWSERTEELSETSSEGVAMVAAQEEPPPRQTAGLLRMIYLCFKRAMLQHSRSKARLLMDQALVFLSAMFISSVYYGDTMFSPPLPRQVFSGCSSDVVTECQKSISIMTNTISTRASMIIIAVTLTGTATMIRVFGTERVVYWREASALPQPRHTLAYLIGKDLSMVPTMLLSPLFFCVLYLSVTTPRASFSTYYFVLLALEFYAASVGYLVSVVAPASLSQLVGVVFVFSAAMFAGGLPTLKQMSTKIIPLRWLPIVSVNRYALEALYVAEATEYQDIVELQGVDLAESMDDIYSYKMDAYMPDLMLCFLFGVIIRVLAFVAMWAKDRAKKQ